MRDNTKAVFGTLIFFVIVWGIIGLISGQGFFTPTIEIIKSFGSQIGEAISTLLTIGLFIGIIWFLIMLFNKK